jgi:hypothetical protein
MIGTISLRYHPLMRRDADCINRHPRLRAEAEQGLRVSAPPRPLYSRLVLALVRESCGLESRDPDSLDPVRSGANEQTEGIRSRIHPAHKTKYSVANWASYDRALVRRGDVTLWLSPVAIATWGTRAQWHAWRAAEILPPRHRNRIDAPSPLPSATPANRRVSHIDLWDHGPGPLRAGSHNALTTRSVPGSLASSSAHGQPVTSRRGQYGPLARW